MRKIRTRFAPSPTGSMHIGNLRTAFYAYALAKHANGDFILRIEDTDKKREKEGGVKEISSLLNIFGLKWDEYYVQSERINIYKVEAEKLVKSDHAFYCQCDAKNAKADGFSKALRDPCRNRKLTSGAIKLKVPENKDISFRDFIVKEEIKWNSDTVFDATLLKSDGYPTYHLAVVVDDHAMNITHVLRGHDWMPSTPIHLLVYEFLGYVVPQIGHLTDILDPEGGKLSKRKGSTSVLGMLKEGYLQEALFNFVILCGWAPKDNRELFTLEDFVKYFDSNGLQKSNPVFNRDKLDWFNGYYIRQKSDDELLSLFGPFLPNNAEKSKVKLLIPLIKDRVKKLSDFTTIAGYVFKKANEIEPMLFTDNGSTHVLYAHKALEDISEADWNLENINQVLMAVIKSNNFKTGDFFMDLRGVVSGNKFTPPLNETLVLIGKRDTLERLEKAIKKKNE